MPESSDQSLAWRLTDHVCRVCFGRVLERDGAPGHIYRCANCGTEVSGICQVCGHRAIEEAADGRTQCGHCGSRMFRPARVHDLCCCGLRGPGGRLGGLKCARNEERTPEHPAELRVLLR